MERPVKDFVIIISLNLIQQKKREHLMSYLSFAASSFMLIIVCHTNQVERPRLQYESSLVKFLCYIFMLNIYLCQVKGQ